MATVLVVGKPPRVVHLYKNIFTEPILMLIWRFVPKMLKLKLFPRGCVNRGIVLDIKEFISGHATNYEWNDRLRLQ